MSLFDLGFVFLKEAWEISIVLVKYMILFVLLYAFWNNREDISAALRETFGALLVKIGPIFILGILVATSISVLFESYLIAYSAFIVVSALLLYLEMPEADLSDSSDFKEKLHISLSIFSLIIIILSFLPLHSLFPKLVAMIFYGIIFWRI